METQEDYTPLSIQYESGDLSLKDFVIDRQQWAISLHQAEWLGGE
jgi:hypothetical protein